MKIINKLKYIKKRYYENKKLKKIFLEQCKQKGEKVFIFGCPIHGNIGDHAILLSEIKFLEDFSEYKIVEVESQFFLKNQKLVKKYIGESIIFLTGGGFLGNLWINEEEVFRKMIQNFEKNKIIVFPQTIYFTNDENGRFELKKSQEIYSTAKKMIFFCREKYSYDFMINNFPKIRTFLAPDMVLYLDNKNINISCNRNDVVCCFRKDKEKQIKNEENIERILKLNGLDSIHYIDTVISDNIYSFERDKIVFNKIKEISNYKLMITDRLHGMIFAYLAQTPCLVFENRSYKVCGVYEWIKKSNYIILCNENDFEEKLNKILKINQIEKKFNIDEYFELLNVIKEIKNDKKSFKKNIKKENKIR